MAEVKKVQTVCRNCHGGCGVIAHVMGGKVVKVEGDPDSPISHGSMCAKGLAVTQMAYHPDRILHPMKKIRGDWQRISWDEALDTVAGQFKEAREKYGAESILIGQGTGRDFESHFSRGKHAGNAQHDYRRAHVLPVPDRRHPDHLRAASGH